MHLVNAFKYAFAGIKGAFKTEKNMKIHLCFGVLAILFGFLFKLSNTEWAILILTIGFVFVTEFFNTALESVVDIISPEKQEKARLAKDVAAAAVLISTLVSVFVAYFLFLSKII